MMSQPTSSAAMRCSVVRLSCLPASNCARAASIELVSLALFELGASRRCYCCCCARKAAIECHGETMVILMRARESVAGLKIWKILCSLSTKIDVL